MSVESPPLQSNDHRHAVETQLHNDVHYYDVFLKSDPKVAICEFCGMDCGTVEALNKHLISCPDNTSGHSAGLFCSICGKMFTQTKNLKVRSAIGKWRGGSPFGQMID